MCVCVFQSLEIIQMMVNISELLGYSFTLSDSLHGGNMVSYLDVSPSSQELLGDISSCAGPSPRLYKNTKTVSQLFILIYCLSTNLRKQMSPLLSKISYFDKSWIS